MPNTVNSYMVTDLGNVSLNPRGEYNATYKYEYLDLIHYKGGSYVCLAPLGDTISGISPVDGSTTTYWQCIAIPGEITQEYKDMYNEVINDANKVEELKNSIDTIELSIKDSETNAKTSETNAKASETNAKTSETKSKENLNSAIQSNSETKNMIIGFDQHVSDTISNSTTTINDLTNSAISSVVEQQNKSLNYIKNQADAYINSEEIIIRADLHQIIDDFNNSTNSKKQEIINSANDKINTMTTIYDNTVDAKNVAETASTTAFEKANEATTSADEAKTSSDEAKANAELVAADKAIVSADKTEIGGMKSAVESSVAKFESDLETYNIPTMNNDITELKGDLDDKVDFKNKTTYTVISEKNIDFSYDNKSLNSAGALIDYSNYATSDFIDISEATGIYRYGTTIKYGMTPYAFYDKNKNFISRVPATGDATTDYELVEYNGKQVSWLSLVENAKYIRIVWQKSRPYTYVVVKEDNINAYDLYYSTMEGHNLLPLYKKKIVNFGDSIFGNFRDTNDTTDKSISKMIEEKTGAIVYNCGFGGCRMATHSNYWDAFSMHSIADAIASEVWTVQENALVSGASALPAYFVETVELLKKIDFSEVDIITIGYGTNDYAGNVFVHGTEASFAEEWNYFKGALKYSIRTILNKYPHIKIVVISPCWRWFLEEGVYSYSSDDDNSKNTRNYKLTDYVDVCEAVCKEYHIPYIDTYYSLGFNEFTHLEYFPQSDGTHPNQNGRQLRADRIIAQLLSLIN